MRALNSAIAMVVFATAAAAQPTAPPAAKGPTHNAALLDVETRVRECMKQWDRSTHMTKQEWEVTCRRVAEERVKHLRGE
jgi:hypothetical protein